MTMRGWSFKITKFTPCAVAVIALLLSTFVYIPDSAGGGDSPEEEVPDPPREPSSSPSISGFGINHATGWNDTSFSFWLNFSSDEEPVNITVQANIDSVPHEMFENDTRDDNYSDGKDYFWNNENRLWSKGFIPYYFYMEINDTDNTTDTSYFEIYNRDPYMLEPPFNFLEIDEEFEWEGRATDEDLDQLNWTLETNMTNDDYSEFEFEEINTSFKINIKCSRTFTRWLNLTTHDYLDNNAYWNWTLYCNHSGGTNFYWVGVGDGISWDDYNNWLIESGGLYAPATVGEYPKDNADQAFLNETADDLYLQDAANSVVTIGELKLSSGFTGSVTQSIDLIIDDAGAHAGHMEVSAGTWDTNTSNEQINLDGYLYLLDTGTFVEREGIVIVQGAAVQEIRVQDSNALYKLTTDTSSTVGELYDNLTAFQITIGTGTTYKADADTRGYELWTNFTDAATCGFVFASSGTLQLTGASSGRGANISGSGSPPTNYWTANFQAADVVMDYANVSYFKQFIMRGDVDIEESGFYDNGLSSREAFYLGSTANIIKATNIPIDKCGIAVRSNTAYAGFNNIVITNLISGGTDVYASNVKLEFVDSNFDPSNVNLVTTGNIISDTHNDIANAYKIMATTLSKSTITNKHDSGDNIELVSGTYTINEASASNDFTVDSDAMLNIDAGTTHTFDPIANLTIEGELNVTGANITTSSEYFDFYNPGQVWLNDSEINSSDLALPFSFYIGVGANSTVNNYTANMGANNMLITLSSETYAAKGSGIVWHMNASVGALAFEVVEFDFGNLTVGESYRLYNNGVLVGTKTADANGMVFFTTTIDDTPDHLNLTWTGEAAPPIPPSGWTTPWLDKPVAYFEYEVLDFKTVNYTGEDRGKYGVKDSEEFDYSWKFGDGSESENDINTTHNYSFFLIKSYDVELTVCDDDVCSSYMREITLTDWPMVALIILLLTVLIVVIVSKRYGVRENQ